MEEEGRAQEKGKGSGWREGDRGGGGGEAMGEEERRG